MRNLIVRSLVITGLLPFLSVKAVGIGKGKGYAKTAVFKSLEDLRYCNTAFDRSGAVTCVPVDTDSQTSSVDIDALSDVQDGVCVLQRSQRVLGLEFLHTGNQQQGGSFTSSSKQSTTESSFTKKLEAI